MSSTIVDELWYYVKQTGDKYVEERLRDTVLWGCQSYNTVEKEYLGGPRSSHLAVSMSKHLAI
jgi:hypothetical protein